MLKELYEAVNKLVEDASEIMMVRPPAEPEHVYLVRGANGAITRHEAEPAPRQHQALSLEAITDFAEEFATEKNRVSVWYSRLGVTAFLDDRTRRDRIDLSLHYSDELIALTPTKGKDHWMLLRDFSRYLRLSLGGCVAPELTKAVRNGTALPELTDVTVPIWRGYAENKRCVINCGTDTSADNMMLLTPLPGEIERAIRWAEGLLGEAIMDSLGDARDWVHVYYGIP